MFGLNNDERKTAVTITEYSYANDLVNSTVSETPTGTIINDSYPVFDETITQEKEDNTERQVTSCFIILPKTIYNSFLSNRKYKYTIGTKVYERIAETYTYLEYVKQKQVLRLSYLPEYQKIPEFAPHEALK